MSEKFRKVVNAPHRAMGKLKKKIAQSDAKDLARKTGMTTTALFQFLLWATKYVTLDNHALRAMERGFANKKIGKNKKGENKKLDEILKKYPNLSSHLLYYLMFAITTMGGIKIAKDKSDEIAYAPPQEIHIEQTTQQAQPNTYGAYLERMRPITPFLIADLISKEGVVIDKETGLHKPYKDSRGIWTIGFGSTVLPGGISVTKDTKPITTERAYDLARWHLENGETYFIMYCYQVGVDKVDINTTKQALLIASVVYNTGTKIIEKPNDKNNRKRFELLRQDFKKYGVNMPDSLVRARFAQYPVVAETSFGRAWLHGKSAKTVAGRLGNFLAGGPGIAWRRWAEAGVMTGDITPQMLMNCPMGGLYEFYKCVGGRNARFFVGDEEHRSANRQLYAAFHKWLKKPVDHNGDSMANAPKVKDYLPKEVLAVCENGKCELGPAQGLYAEQTSSKFTMLSENIDAAPVADVSDDMYASANAAYKKGDYQVALKKYLSLQKSEPDNAALRNDIAATYNKMAMYDMAIDQARQIITRIKDKKQYAAAYYNAGVAYEQKGDLQKALANYKLALANGNKRVQSDITRVTGLAQIGNAKNAKSKRFAFNVGAEKMKKTGRAKMRNMHDFATRDDYTA